MRISYLSTTICVIDITISSNQLILFTEINLSSLSTVRKLVNYILDEIQSRHIMTSYGILCYTFQNIINKYYQWIFDIL